MLRKRRTIAVTIICCNEEDRIEACLDSVDGWADQIIILDSGSSDKTVDIAMKYDAEIYSTDWPGYGRQRARALAKVQCEWVFAIDADERASKELKLEIDNLLTQEVVPCSVYRIPWVPFFLGKKLRNGRYASPQARLFIKKGAHYPSAQIHETLIFPPGKVGYLRGGLIHYSYRNYGHCIAKHNEYSWLLSKEKYAKRKSSNLFFATIRSWWEFIHQFFFRKLFLDGWHGYLQAIVLKQYSFNKYAGLWSLQQTKAEIDPAFESKHRGPSLVDISDEKVTRLK
ncbi:glycosyltransferase family 2 protein [Alteromonas sp. D210916BOD_24]|uniref:glycosyltransferase family 2 protein n=1 Tax=Alteromonas sp. D210916BOD_24 TaxID=3157618 RepID=UPI00399C7DAE